MYINMSVRMTTGDGGNLSPDEQTKEDRDVDTIKKAYVMVREYQRGQTMAEYALIMAAVAVVVFAGYQTMGTTITTLLSTVDTKL